jgi:anaerobic selenocysteine-containing dehydrogenase
VESKLIIFWASNPLNTGLHVWPFVQEAKRRGAQLMTIDPYCSRTARVCDEHLFLRPGTDAALARAMMKVIEEERLTDADYIRHYTVGYEQFAERLHALSLDELSRTCDVPLRKIREFAHAYATTKPATIRMGIGIQRCGGAAADVRAVACLPAQTGAWRAVAAVCVILGAMFTAQDTARAMRPDLSPADVRKSIWCDWLSICSILALPSN